MNLLPLLVACGGDFSRLRVRTLDAQETVLEVTWQAQPGDLAAVEYGEGLTAPELDDGDPDTHRVLVLGLPQLHDVTLRPVIYRDGERIAGEERSEETGTLPPDLPALELAVNEADRHAGGFVFVSTVGNPRSVIAVDREGRIVWYYVPEEPLVSVDPEVNRFGPGFLVPLNTANREEDLGVMRTLGLDGELVREAPMPLAHHVFEQIDGAQIAFLAMALSEGPEGQPVVGDDLQLQGADGALRTLWSSWDRWTWDGVEVAQEEFYPQGYDFTHGNGLFYDADADSLIYSTRNLNALVELDARTGEELRAYGVDEGTVFSPGDSAFEHQHCPTRTPEGTLLVFDNGDPSKTPGRPRTTLIREYEEGEGSLTQIASFGLRENLNVQVLGCATRLPGGNTMSDWGSAGELVEFDPDGEIVWRVSGRAGVIFGNSTWVPDLYAVAGVVELP